MLYNSDGNTVWNQPEGRVSRCPGCDRPVHRTEFNGWEHRTRRNADTCGGPRETDWQIAMKLASLTLGWDVERPVPYAADPGERLDAVHPATGEVRIFVGRIHCGRFPFAEWYAERKRKLTEAGLQSTFLFFAEVKSHPGINMCPQKKSLMLAVDGLVYSRGLVFSRREEGNWNRIHGHGLDALLARADYFRAHPELAGELIAPFSARPMS